MKTISNSIDKAAIGLSLACAIHCLLLPIALTMIPALAGNIFGDERLHLWMLFAVLPTSIIALTMGCRQHRKPSVMALGLLGLAILTLTIFFAHDYLGEAAEKAASMLGASIIAFSHWRNYTMCQNIECCETTAANPDNAY